MTGKSVFIKEIIELNFVEDKISFQNNKIGFVKCKCQSKVQIANKI